MKNIYVGNLDFSATEESIRSLFAPHGTVEKVHLATDRETGRSPGFAFVEMAEGDADKAIAALNGTIFGGRAPSLLTRRDRRRIAPGAGRRVAPVAVGAVHAAGNLEFLC